MFGDFEHDVEAGELDIHYVELDEKGLENLDLLGYI